MTAEEKLDKLYAIRGELHPLTMVLIVGFKETQNGILKLHDIRYVEEIYPLYFGENHE